jgi:hypothetical protein
MNLLFGPTNTLTMVSTIALLTVSIVFSMHRASQPPNHNLININIILLPVVRIFKGV